MNYKITLIIVFSILLFIPSWGNYFSGDDWYHLRLGQIDNLGQFINYFSFSQNDQIASFYRPLSTQVFFFVFQKLFGLWALPWYMFVSFMFGLSIWLVYRVIKEIGNFLDSKNEIDNLALVSAFIYGISVTHFTHLYFLSTFQEILMTVGVLGAVFSYLRNRKLISVICWIIGLLSKETAVVFPPLIYMFEILKNYKFNDFSFKYIVQLNKYLFNKTYYLAIILSIYLFLRFVIFSPIQGVSYVWDFSPIRAMNTIMWYGLWSLGVPEMVVDFIGSGLRPIPRFYTAFGNWWIVITLGVFIIFGLISILFTRNYKKIDKLVLSLSLWFLIGLFPVMFLPWHKFTLELGLPMVGMSGLLAWLICNSKYWGKTFLGAFLIYNIFANRIMYEYHYSVGRSQISRNVVNYFLTNYPSWPEDQVWMVDNNNNDSSEWGGSSKQVAHSINRSEFFKVIYKDKQIEVKFQGLDIGEIPNNAIQIYSGQFIPK